MSLFVYGDPVTSPNSTNDSNSVWLLVLAYGLWLVLAVLSGVVLWQVYSALVYLSTIWLSNPDWRPSAWNSYTISGLARFLALVIGIVWLALVTFMERYLRLFRNMGDLWRKTARLAALLILLFALSYAVFWIR